MPTLIDLRLKATWTVTPDTRKLHGLACALFEGQDAAPGEHAGQHKQFSISPLRPAPGGTATEWSWRVAWLPDSPLPATAVDPGALRVGHVTCAVTETIQRRVTRAALASGAAPAGVTVSFGSPTYFAQNGTGVLLPDPRLITGSWRRRWNASLPSDDPLLVGEDAWKPMHQSLTLAAFDLRTSTRDTGHDRDQPGFTGTATLRLPRNAPKETRQLLSALARFAEFSGTGAQITHGFGVTTPLECP